MSSSYHMSTFRVSAPRHNAQYPVQSSRHFEHLYPMRTNEGREGLHVAGDEDDPNDDDGQTPMVPAEEHAPSERSVSPGPNQRRLKIKLKVPLPTSSASGSVTPVADPDDDSVFSPNAGQRPGSSRIRNIVQDTDMDSQDDEDEFEDDVPSRSTPPSTPGGLNSARGRAMTTRQAALATGLRSSPPTPVNEVSAQLPTGKGKKKQLNETEIALRREETARKRRNLTEKKLEDEKSETINRLLKKQTRAKTKRAAAGAGRPATPVTQKSKEDFPGASPGDEDAMDIDEDGIPVQSTPAVPSPPSMYRWVSTSRTPQEPGTEANAETPSQPKMSISFSVPPSLLPEQDVASETGPPAPRQRPLCDYAGCSSESKYRLVKDWHRWACGMQHLKELEQSMNIAV